MKIRHVLALWLILKTFCTTQSDLVRKCDGNYCFNDGHCYLTSAAQSSAKCPHGFYSEPDETCLQHVQVRKTFVDANKFCQQHYNGHLVWMKSLEKRSFVESLMTKDVWIGAQRDKNGLRWYPNGTRAKLEVVDGTAERNSLQCTVFYSNYGDSIVTSEFCDEPHEFLCESGIAQFEGAEDWLRQCSCQEGFTGRFCERVSGNGDGLDSEGHKDGEQDFDGHNGEQGSEGEENSGKGQEDSGGQKELCANDVFYEKCDGNKVLDIDYAVYGYSPQFNYSKLCILTSNLAEDCIEAASLIKMIQRCKGRQECKISRMDDLFGHPACSNGARLMYRTSCVERSTTTCKNGMIQLNDRCIEISNSKDKMSYEDARAECTQKGGDLAVPTELINFSELLKSIKPLPSSEYWINNSTETFNYIGPRKAECFTASWWSTNVGQVPCFANLGWICEYVPNGTGDRVIGTKFRKHDKSSGQSSEEVNQRCSSIKFHGMKVPEANLCQSVEINCPNGLMGKMKINCLCDKPKWHGLDNFSQCMSPSISPLRDLVHNGDPYFTIGKFEHNIFQLMEANKLTSGDVYQFIESGDLLMAKAMQNLHKEKDHGRKKSYSAKFSMSIGKTGDYLLDKRAEPAWFNMTDDIRVERAARLMQLMQNMLVLRANGVESGHKEKFKFGHFASNLEVKDEIQHNPVLSTSRIMVTHDEFEKDSEEIRFDGFDRAVMDIPSTDILGFAAHAKHQPRFGIFSRVMNPTTLSGSTGNGHQKSSTGRGGFRSSGTADRKLNPEADEGFRSDGTVNQNLNPEADNEAQNDQATTISDDDSKIKVGQFMFKNIGKLMTNKEDKKRVNSYVIGAFVNDPAISVDLMNQHVNFTFYHLVKEGVSNPQCVFWNLTSRSWDNNGCTMPMTTSDYTKCSCTHLTSFAILMDFTNSLEEMRHDDGLNRSSFVETSLDWLTFIGCTLSIVSLTICILIFTIFKSLYNSRTTIHRNLCISLLMAEVLFLFGIDDTEYVLLCRVVAIALHYFFLCAFAWMLLEGYQLYLMLIKVFDAKSRTLWYYCCGYLMPAIIVFASVLVSVENYGTEDYCWIDVTTPTIYTFVAPIGLIVLFNSGVLILALRTVLAVRNRDRSLAARVFGWLKGSAMLLFLLGITWVFGFLSAIHVFQPYVAYIFTVLNSLQGTFIFFLHVIMNDKARQCVSRCLRDGVCCQAPLSSSMQSKNGVRPDSSSYNKSNNFFALRKDRILQWWPLKSSNSNSRASNGEKQGNSEEPQVQVIDPRPELKHIDSKDEEDEVVTRKRLLSPDASLKIERF